MKNALIIILIIVVVLAAAGIYFYSARPKTLPFETTQAKIGNIAQIVSVTGKVKPAANVNLAFERSGRVVAVSVNVGDSAVEGQVLASLDSSDLQAQLAQAQAQLAAQQAILAQLKSGPRPEELQIAQTNVTNAQKALLDAQANLANTTNSASANLQQVYTAALNSAAHSVLVAGNSLYVLTDLQSAYFLGSDQNSLDIARAKAIAVASLLGGQDAGRWTNNYLSQLDGGAKAAAEAAQANPTNDNIDIALTDVADALSKVQSALATVPVNPNFSALDRSNLNIEKNNISAEIITTAGKQQAIIVQKAANKYNIESANTALTGAQNALSSAQNQLSLTQAGSTADQIAAQQAQVNAAAANINNLQIQIQKTQMRAPLSGVVTEVDAKIGQIVSPNAPLVSVMSASQFQIEVNVPEADIAKIAPSQGAAITLDAYGNGVNFDAKVVKIDPAETVIEGVATYKVTMQFLNSDPRIKSGMTANIDISTAQKAGVVVIPQRAIIQKNNQSFVLLVAGDNTTSERQVTTGLKGSDGNIEIVSGLTDGQKIVSFGGAAQ